MREAFSDFEWPVATAYEWTERLDRSGQPLIHAASIHLFERLDEKGKVVKGEPDALQSCGMVETAWQRFEDEGPGTGPVLIPVREVTAANYRPMQRLHAGLFLKFAKLDYRNLEAIRGFAAAHGSLGVPAKDYYGESHLAWAREICLMREAVRATKSRTARDDAADHAAWQRYGLEPPHEDRRKRRAWLFNVHLQHVQARMLFKADRLPRLSYVPLTLLAAMWLQLSLAVAEDKQFLECKFCRRLFELSTDDMGFRSHREFCSGACKTKDYRVRKRTTLKLAKGGASVEAIADRTDTNPETVQKWIATASAEGKEKD